MIDNKTTWIRVYDSAEFKPGMKARIIERFASGATITAEGEIERVYLGDDGYLRCELVGVPPTERSVPPEGWSVEMYRQPKELPLHAGSAIKVYDNALLRDRVAVRRLRHDVIGREELAWYWADQQFEQFVPPYLLENAEILFDASKAYGPLLDASKA